MTDLIKIYDFELNSKITVISGNSGTGKSTLTQLIKNNSEKYSNYIYLDADVLTPEDVFNRVAKYKEYIFLLGESDVRKFESIGILSKLLKKNAYFVVIVRDILEGVNYSYKDIYCMYTEGNYHTLKRKYTDYDILNMNSNFYITEDEGLGHDYYKNYLGNNVYTSKDKDNLEYCLQRNYCGIADRLPIGSCV